MMELQLSLLQSGLQQKRQRSVSPFGAPELQHRGWQHQHQERAALWDGSGPAA